MRGLSDNFVGQLRNGYLSPILKVVQMDSTLCLEIRENYINVYYRGGNLIQIDEMKSCFSAFFDKKYSLNPGKFKELPSRLGGADEVNAWVEALPYLKYEMDLYFGRHPKDEREFQQLMVRENNFGGPANGTDYFICDIEYAVGSSRFDLIAVKWPSISVSRKGNSSLVLAFIEMKYVDKALDGAAGLGKHVTDMDLFLEDGGRLQAVKDDMKTIFNQKHELGLINNAKSIESFSDEKPECILVLANHDPDSSILRESLRSLPACRNVEVKIATSSFMGYGLYSQGIFGLEEFCDRYQGRY